ncbi:hypothetical protein SETIT_6G165700v2 [Setaria italica]|uniref:CASP-like protein n=1 Tax=Setaria italica TaxID=4555 RepID=A0A368RMH2_SETIT|nr:hypothetical protein SETIT_6G165700v2 [Setaria italica]
MASRAQTAALVMALSITAALRAADLASSQGHELGKQPAATAEPATGEGPVAASTTAALLLVSVTYFLNVIVVHTELILAPAPNGIVVAARRRLAAATASFAGVVASLLALAAAAYERGGPPAAAGAERCRELEVHAGRGGPRACRVPWGGGKEPGVRRAQGGGNRRTGFSKKGCAVARRRSDEWRWTKAGAWTSYPPPSLQVGGSGSAKHARVWFLFRRGRGDRQTGSTGGAYGSSGHRRGHRRRPEADCLLSLFFFEKAATTEKEKL